MDRLPLSARRRRRDKAWSRRSFLRAATAAALVPGVARAASLQCRNVPPAPTSPPAWPAGTVPLGDLARDCGLLLGMDVDFDKSHSYDGPHGGGFYDPVVRELIAREHFQILAYDQGFIFGNAARLPPGPDGALRFSEGDHKSWYEVDDATPLIRASGARARADALIWNTKEGTPGWLKPLPQDGDWPASEAYRFNAAAMERYIEAAFAKMQTLSTPDPDFFHSVGVVNEPIFHAAGGASRWSPGPLLADKGTASIAESRRVPDYLERALRTADRCRNTFAPRGRSLAPKLFLNDTNDGFDASTLQMIDLIRKQKIPLDAIGLECHWQPDRFADPGRPDWKPFGRLVDEIGHRGLEVYITELDVLDLWTSCQGHTGTVAESDRLTATYFGSFMEEMLRHPAVKMVTLFTPFDRYSWYREEDISTWARPSPWLPEPDPPHCPVLPQPQDIACPRPGIYDDLMRVKPARAAIAAALEAAR